MIDFKEKEQSLFVEKEHASFFVRLVATFAIVYYGLFFLFMVYLGIFYDTVYDPSYLGEAVDSSKSTLLLISYITRTLLLGAIIASLILIFRKRGYGKIMFLICTVVLIVFQIFTTTPPAWSSYIIEAFLALIIAPFKVVAKFNENVIEGTRKLKEKQKTYVKKPKP